MNENYNILPDDVSEINQKLLNYIGDIDDSYFDGEQESSFEGEETEDVLVDDTFNDIDFSQFKGKNFKSDYKKVSRITKNKKPKKKVVKRKKKPLVKAIAVEHKAVLHGEGKKMSKVIVPRDKKVIIEGVDKFLVSSSDKDNAIRNIGYYKGEKLKELVLTFNNNSALDFNLELFNPSMPLDYLYSTSLNLNNKIQVAGGGYVSYTDVLYNLLGNPLMLVNAKFTFSGTVTAQQSEPIVIKSKNVAGEEKIYPYQLQLQIDNMQVLKDIIFFDFPSTFGRPYFADGMEVAQYKVLAGNTITMAFYYKQRQLKKFFFPEAKEVKGLL